MESTQNLDLEALIASMRLSALEHRKSKLQMKPKVFKGGDLTFALDLGMAPEHPARPQPCTGQRNLAQKTLLQGHPPSRGLPELGWASACY